MNATTPLDVSAVVCCWNSIASIGKCLDSLRRNEVGEIIVVDADSDDGTREVASVKADKVLSDPRMGLATARNIGIRAASKDFVLNVGADNIMPNGSVQNMIEYMSINNYTGISAQTEIICDPMTYLAWAMNLYKKARFYPGERSVIGTPTLFRTKVLQENPYDPKMSWSDDGDLCTRLASKGAKFAISDTIVGETGSESLKSVLYRWKGYGKSDWETFSKYSNKWSLYRKIKSMFYPLRHELLYPFFRLKIQQSLQILPFLFLITTIRYFYWVKFYIKGNQK